MSEITKKEQEDLRKLVDHHESVVTWEKHVGAAVWVLYFAAVAVWIFTDSVKAFPLFMMALLMIVVRLIIGREESKRRHKVIRRIHKLNRKAVTPFFEDLKRKFADDPKMKITLDDSGTIHIDDSRNKGEKK